MSPKGNEAARRLVSVVTRHWARIAAGIVVLLGLAELTIGGITADSSVELWLTAWAATTGGLWFLAEKAERSLTHDVRSRVTVWLLEANLERSIASIPDQFAHLFDRVFGEKHWSRHCFNRSCAASFYSVMVVTIAAMSFGWVDSFVLSPGIEVEGRALAALTLFSMIGPMVVFNFLPDYLSLLETRWAIRWIDRSGRLLPVLAADAVATAFISLTGIIAALVAMDFVGLFFSSTLDLVTERHPPQTIPWQVITTLIGVPSPSPADAALAPIIRISFASAFFTSVWLWLYVASVMFARSLVRVGGGVGLLLRVTDLERHPFRSVGFVTIILVSVVFLVALPLVFAW